MKGDVLFIVERQKNGNLLWYDPQSGQNCRKIPLEYETVEDMGDADR